MVTSALITATCNGCMTRVAHIIAGAMLTASICPHALADERSSWSAEVLIGDAFNFNSRTHLEVASSDVVLNGDYETRGFEAPLHYTVRLARWDGDRAWELQLLHHKLYLQNRPQGVEALSVSHGFNIVSINRAFASDPWRFRIGVGPVIAHPEAQIGATSYDGPYELAGAAVLGAIGAQFELTQKLWIAGEIAATFGYVDVHPHGEPDLSFSIRNPALHAQVGLGYRF
jgi:hypothetical protein